MQRILSFIIAASLIAIVVLLLIRNKQEINAQIEFAEKKVEAYPVRVAEVQNGMLDMELNLSGILSGTHELMLMAETQGRISSIHKSEGDWVSVGEMIAQVDDELMRAELMVTEANYEKAKKDLGRAEALIEGGAITEQQLEGLQLQAKAAEAKYRVAKKRVADAYIKAPVPGYINKLFIQKGGMIGAGVPVCELVNTRALEMTVEVDEEHVNRIATGMHVMVSSNGASLQATVKSVEKKANYALQYGVDLAIPQNNGDMLKAGMIATASFVFEDDELGPVIPATAITGSEKEPEVFIIKDDRVRLVPVEIVRRADDQLKISHGLSAGDIVVTQGQFNLEDGMKVKVIE